MSLRKDTLVAALAVVGLFALWEASVRLFGIPPFVLPSPSQAVLSLVPVWGVVVGHAWQTLWTTLAGFGLAVATGVLLGAAVGTSRPLNLALYPLLVGFNSVPKAALVPVLVLWFGIGTVPAILTAFLISFFPIVVNVATGLAAVPPELREVLRVLGSSRLEAFTRVSIPFSMPYFFASLKVAITLAFVGAVISEIAASQKGIGYMMTSASSQFNVPLVFGGLLVIAAMGILLYAVFALLERRLVGWAYRNQSA
ncbi:MAG: ABC transporter permease [Meiothermus sp.]|uniref:ABC transporter permease n=1 Tax=Meiothermus sp. TaxID=1955249 RepID=UPI0025DF0B7C|nr:ABC transporter permease [Meiothermus sp.]MCS7059250.1 ABC transporter permease [Meiothermus sp.]MCS7193845.1 ABC transporter permease [Meiothermus sp.]MCX7739556.1 ABC transporter permease [Meiothermus sp.]MDW8090305.1 ABC transporter permease [Meiothermus sp.]MDW8481266.1 ABC transporter permease [Meiothermus sp.]